MNGKSRALIAFTAYFILAIALFGCGDGGKSQLSAGQPPPHAGSAGSGPSLALVLTDQSNSPLANVKANLVFDSEPDFFSGMPGHPQRGEVIASATSAADGSLSYSGLPTGSYRLKFDSELAKGVGLSISSLQAEQHRNLGVHKLNRIVEIGGQVLEADGQPVVGVVVQLRRLAVSPEMGRQFLASAEMDGKRSRTRWQRTDGEGNYRFDKVSEGDYVVDVVPAVKPRVATIITVAAGLDNSSFDLRLPTGKRVYGYVSLDSGGDLAGVRYAIIGEADHIDSYHDWQHLLAFGKPLNRNGGFNVQVEGNDYAKWLAVTAPGHSVEYLLLNDDRGEQNEVHLKNKPAFAKPRPNHTQPINLSTGTVRVKVSDGQGNPLEGVAVTVDAPIESLRQLAISDADGMVEYKGVNCGDCDLRFYRQGLSKKKHRVSLRKDANELIEITLLRTTTLIIQYEGNDPQQEVVEIRRRNGLFFEMEKSTDKKGYVEFTDLDPGSYFVSGLPKPTIVDLKPAEPYVLTYTDPVYH